MNGTQKRKKTVPSWRRAGEAQLPFVVYAEDFSLLFRARRLRRDLAGRAHLIH